MSNLLFDGNEYDPDTFYSRTPWSKIDTQVHTYVCRLRDTKQRWGYPLCDAQYSNIYFAMHSLQISEETREMKGFES
jgi:hypothetical protein